MGAKSWPYGAHGYSTPSALNCTQKRCENASASVKLNYRSLPVGPQRGKDDRHEYKTNAFETVNHFILINKLRKYGIHGNVLEWFIIFIDNQKQHVFYNGSLLCGVSQGSMIGPLLFILYVSDLSNISESLTFILFADDTTVIESDSVSDAIALMNLELIKLNIWLQANKLTLNTKKTYYIVFDRGKKPSGNNLLTLNNKSIGYVKFTNSLGARCYSAV